METKVAIHLHATPTELDQMDDDDLEHWYAIAEAVEKAKSK